MIKAAVVFVALCVVFTQAAETTTPTTFRFDPHTYTVREDVGKFTIQVVREGKTPTGNIEVKYTTVDGTAKAGEDFEATSGKLEFTPSDKDKTIELKIINNPEEEPTEEFTVTLEIVNNEAVLGNEKVAKIIVLDKKTTT